MNRWFHPNLSTIDAERLLMERGLDGSFLVRPSRTSAGQFSLSIKRNNTVTHIKIRHTNDLYDLHGGEQFATLPELIQHYTENPIKEKNGVAYKLGKPITSSDPTTERWFHGSISGFMAEKLIREKGVNGSFLVRESQSKVGDYVLTVRTKDESSQTDKITHVVIRHFKNKYDIGGGGQFSTLTQLVEHYKRNPMVEESGTVLDMIYPFNATSITASDIDDRVEELCKENPDIGNKEGFWEEFEHLQHQECKVLFSRKVGQEDRNISKNRYKNILPYDYTRVILKKPMSFVSRNDSNSDQLDSDYINANYIKLVNEETIGRLTKPVPHSKIYIATQGPLPNTINDFWWMVWQEKSDCILMVTKEVERGKNKCCRYWPSLEQSKLRCGPIEILIISDEPNTSCDDDYSIRQFELRYIGSDENNDCLRVHRLVQYHYRAWPDQNIPSNPASILRLLNRVNCDPPKGPMIVHCSAGIGRSGTLIVIDMLLDQLKHFGLGYEIDIQRIVKMARAQRSGLVQTEAQYKFIYLAVQSYIQSLK